MKTRFSSDSPRKLVISTNVSSSTENPYKASKNSLTFVNPRRIFSFAKKVTDFRTPRQRHALLVFFGRLVTRELFGIFGKHGSQKRGDRGRLPPLFARLRGQDLGGLCSGQRAEVVVPVPRGNGEERGNGGGRVLAAFGSRRGRESVPGEKLGRGRARQGLGGPALRPQRSQIRTQLVQGLAVTRWEGRRTQEEARAFLVVALAPGGPRAPGVEVAAFVQVANWEHGRRGVG